MFGFSFDNCAILANFVSIVLLSLRIDDVSSLILFRRPEPWGTVLSRLPSSIYVFILSSVLFGSPTSCISFVWLPFRLRIHTLFAQDKENAGSPQLTHNPCITWIVPSTPQSHVKSRHIDKPVFCLPFRQRSRHSACGISVLYRYPCYLTVYA